MKKLKPYLITTSIVLIIFLIIFISKGIFPFGNNSLIWGDMHDQITAFYYHFYDSFKDSSSLLINFSTSSGINFIGILAYYILSPFSFITLLFPRDQIYLAVSIIVALKILASSLTCLYFIRTYFKKLSCLLSIFLAIIYAFSGYSLMMYQITPWIDLMCLFPILMIGLKKVLDLEKPTLYIVILTASLIVSFYVSIMVIIFIFLASLIYLFSYKEKEERKKGVLALGITTVISLLLASFIVVPSYLQISVSSRMQFNMTELLNSKTGPITDKLSMFMFGGIMYVGLVLLIKNWKKNKQFIMWYLPTCLIMLIPVIIEPVNKMWHFGSYAFFPYRAGFIMMFLLIIGACYGLERYRGKKEDKKIGQAITSIISSVVVIIGMIFLTINYYDEFQIALETLTISGNHTLLWLLLFTTLLSSLGCFLILLIYKKIDKLSLVLIGLITVTHIICNGFLYLGIDFTQGILLSQYEDLQKIEKTYDDGNYYRVKNITDEFMMNSGMVMKYHTLDHFTSLTDGCNIRTLKKLGYSSMWVKTYSKGGTLFTDALLSNKYIMTKEKLDNPYYKLIDKYGELYFYESTFTPSYGYYLEDNPSIMDKDNSFEIQNSIYNSITNKKELFEIYNDFSLVNIKMKNNNDKISYRILDEDIYNYLEKEITITEKSRVYLEILGDIDNNNNTSIYKKFNIYINDELFKQKAITEYDNGVIDLGSYENETLNIKIELIDNVELDNLTIGLMDVSKYEEFLTNEKIDLKISYNENKIKVKVNSDKKQLLFLPIAYNDGYSVKNNGKSLEIIKVFDNYLGVMLEVGDNNITFKFIPSGLTLTLCISLITLIGTIIILKTGLYNKLLEIKWLSNFAYYVYLIGYLAIIFFVYIVMTVCFMLSYFVFFQV